MLLCVLFLYIWIYITNYILVFSNFFTRLRLRGTRARPTLYALRLAIAPEFFYCCYMCLFYVCSGLLK